MLVNSPDLPLECWTSNDLGKIVSKIGKPISNDKLNSTEGRLSYARVLVEVDAFIELVRSVKMKLPNGKLKEQVLYENVPKFYSTCKMFGHSTLGCNLNKQAAVP